jgi:hypothetical protein
MLYSLEEPIIKGLREMSILRKVWPASDSTAFVRLVLGEEALGKPQ